MIHVSRIGDRGWVSHFYSYYSCYLYSVVLLLYSVFDKGNAWNGGLGFDGVTYFNYFSCLPGCLFEIDSYHVNRLLVPSLAKVVFVALGIEESPRHFVLFYSVFNYIILVSTYVLCLKMLQRGQRLEMQGLLFLCFLAYPLLKGPVFYPSLGDYAGCFLFAAIFYCSQVKRTFIMFFLAAAAFFCHALLLPVSAVLCSIDLHRQWFVPRRVFSLLKFLAFGAVLIAGIDFVFGNMFHAQPAEVFVVDIMFVVFGLPFSVFLLLLLVARLFESVQLDEGGGGYKVPALNFRLLSVFILLFVALVYFKSHFPSTYIKGSSFSWFVTHLLYVSSERILAPIASSFIYFGPLYIYSLVCFLFYSQRNALSVLHSFALFLFFVFSMRPESRTVMFFWPIVAVITLQNFGALVSSSRSMFWVLLVASVATSQALLPTSLVERFGNKWVSYLYFNYQGGYDSIVAWMVSLSCATALALYIIFANRRIFDFKFVPRWCIKPLLCYLLVFSLAVYVCSFSSLSTLAKEVLCFTPRDLLAGDSLLVNNINMGDLEKDANKRWKWSFGPSSEIIFFSLSKETLTLRLDFYAPVPSQVASISINNRSPVVVNLGSLPVSPDMEDGRRVLSIPFIPRYGINTISLSYNSWNGHGFKLDPADDRKFAVQFLNITLSAPIPESYRHTFPYYFFLYDNVQARSESAFPVYP